MSNSSNAPTESIVDRAQNFISEHKKAVIIGSAAAVLAIGASLYLSSSSSPSPKKSSGNDIEKGKKKHKKKKADGPALEEKKPTPKVQDAPDVQALTTEQIFAMSDEERTSLAKTYKGKGNESYQLKNFAQAAEYYSKAIEVSPQSEAVYYSNRAACYVNMSPPQYEKVVDDCNHALELDPKYIKALNRRAMALEGLHRYEEALRDFTAAVVFHKFQDNNASNSMERVLKKLSSQKAAEILKTREPRLPSFTFVSAYFAAFRHRPAPTFPSTTSSQGDQTLLLAFGALEAKDYVHAASLVNESLEQGVSWNEGKAEALNLRATFRFLTGDVEGAKTDLQESVALWPSFTQSHVKLASVHMEQGDPEKTFKCFDEAKMYNPNDPDIYYHLGQVLFIMEDYGGAAENYTKSTELDDQFVFSHIQLAVAQYKSGNLGSSMATFRRTLKLFPQRSEPHNYYGELLLDQQRFAEAIEKFEKAIELERSKTPQNVLPLVNKGLALYQSSQSVDAAERCCNEALRIDPECEAAVATLAQLSLQQSKIDEAIKMFDRQCELARTEPELANALSYKYASLAQMEFTKNYPKEAEELNKLSSVGAAMMANAVAPPF